MAAGVLMQECQPLPLADLEAIAAEPYEQRGILHSEMALVISYAKALGIEVFAESGRARGQSTYLLAKHLPNVQIYSIECDIDHPDEAYARERLKAFPNLTLLEGDGAHGLIGLCLQSGPRRTAVLCDGPKGFNAIATVKLCLRFEHVLAGFIHDMRPSKKRIVAEAILPKPRFSDDPDYVSAHTWMDVRALAAGACGPRYREAFGSYGPTLGVFLAK